MHNIFANNSTKEVGRSKATQGQGNNFKGQSNNYDNVLLGL